MDVGVYPTALDRVKRDPICASVAVHVSIEPYLVGPRIALRREELTQRVFFKLHLLEHVVHQLVKCRAFVILQAVSERIDAFRIFYMTGIGVRGQKADAHI